MPCLVGMRRLIIFARAPRRGHVKTRLAAELGRDAALALHRALGLRAIDAARAVPDASVTVRFTPTDGRALVAGWLDDAGLGDLTYEPQGEGDLGARLAAAVGDAVRDGATAVVVIGTDCPGIDADVIVRAFVALAEADVVLGPAADGGYYLLAVRAPHAALFDGIPWSTGAVLRATLDAAAAAGLRTALLDVRSDVDTADDWRRWVTRRERQATAPPHELPAPAVQP